MKERTHVTLWSNIALKMKAIKDKLFPEEDLAQLHMERTNLADFNKDRVARRSEMDKVTRIYMGYNR